MDENPVANEKNTELDWQTLSWADEVRELIERKGKSYTQIVELLEKMDLRFFSWDLLQDNENISDWVRAYREVSYNKRLGAYWAGKA